MEPYDSFYCPARSPDRAIRLVYIAASRLGVKIAVRLQPGGFRVWRLPDASQD